MKLFMRVVSLGGGDMNLLKANLMAGCHSGPWWLVSLAGQLETHAVDSQKKQ